MKLLIRAVRVLDLKSPHHDQVMDLLLEEGRIAAIGANLEAEADEQLEANGLCVCPGWFDSFAHFCDPGEEYKEYIGSGLNAAAAGGFTAVAIIPATEPVLDSKAGIEYVRSKAEGHAVALYPMAAVSQGRKGENLTEMYDMREAGALAFSEGDLPLRHPGLMLRGLRYVKPFGGLIVNLPLETELTGKVDIHEGFTSTAMGMSGIPGMAEALMVQRDIQLAEYTGSRVHFPMLSSRRSVELVRQAKARDIQVSAGVAAYHLLLDDSDLKGYDTLLKVRPPIRAAEDREALIQGLIEGTIDGVCSNHIPQHEDGKKVEFEYADPGINGLETTFAVMNTALADRMPLADRLDLLGRRMRGVFSLEQPCLVEGREAELTLFYPDEAWTPKASEMRSRARNNPFLGRELKGRVHGVYSRGLLNVGQNQSSL